MVAKPEYTHLAALGRFMSLRPELSYNHTNKQKFKKLAMAAAKELLWALGPKDATMLRWNEGGIAGSGEAIVHTASVYVQFSQSYLADKFMFRLCNGTQDYTGDTNQWMTWEGLKLNPALLIARIHALQEMKLSQAIPKK